MQAVWGPNREASKNLLGGTDLPSSSKGPEEILVLNHANLGPPALAAEECEVGTPLACRDRRRVVQENVLGPSQLFVRKQGELAKVSPTSQGIHPSHTHMFWAGIHFCARCGGWGKTNVIILASPCKGVPALAGASALKRIHRGLPPTNRAKVEEGAASMRPLLVSESR